MKLDKILYRDSALYFAGFLLLAIVAFWPGYFSKILGPVDGHLHRHGLTMTLWCLQLITQAVLIRKGKLGAHKKLGRLSYLLAPLVVLAALDLIHFRFYRITQFSPEALYALALMVNGVFAFAIIYGLGVGFRKRPTLHARLMAATVFPLFTPITDRLIYQFLPNLVPLAPTIGRAPIVPFYGFLLADLILLGLVVWDGLSNGQWKVFPVILVILLCYHASVFTFYSLNFWEDFGWWFVQLPFE